MESLYVRDFDFGIEDVLLAHKYYYGVGVDFSRYMKGSTVSGLVYCISGEALYRFGSMEVVLHPGELIFLPASASYSVACLGDEAFCHITVNFNIPAEELKLSRSLYTQMVMVLSSKSIYLSLATFAMIHEYPVPMPARTKPPSGITGVMVVPARSTDSS